MLQKIEKDRRSHILVQNWTHFNLRARQRAEEKIWARFMLENPEEHRWILEHGLDYARAFRCLYISFALNIDIVIEKGGASSVLSHTLLAYTAISNKVG